MWFPCALTLWVLDLSSLGLDTPLLFHLIWKLAQSCCTIQLSHQCLVVCMMSCLAVILIPLQKGICSMYVTDFRGTWYGLLFGFSCNVNVPSKQPIQLKIFSKSLELLCDFSTCSLMIIAIRAWMEILFFIRYFVINHGFIYILLDFEMLSVFVQYFFVCFLHHVCILLFVPWALGNGLVCTAVIDATTIFHIYCVDIHAYDVKHIKVRHA